MMAMRNPYQIGLRRKELERELEKLDDEEQAWEELSRLQRLTELIHAIQCQKNHGDYHDYCQYHNSRFSNPNGARSSWTEKVRKFLGTLPEDWDDEKVLAVARMAPK
jgi:hypothetical protein